jgi:hypothetical protein
MSKYLFNITFYYFLIYISHFVPAICTTRNGTDHSCRVWLKSHNQLTNESCLSVHPSGRPACSALLHIMAARAKNRKILSDSNYCWDFNQTLQEISVPSLVVHIAGAGTFQLSQVKLL